ncbi:MAG: hypothetical protein J7501_03490 [Bdellovibrio sp.]|nr:hypothetical protein [Bdellovibrio sp.]
MSKEALELVSIVDLPPKEALTDRDQNVTWFTFEYVSSVTSAVEKYAVSLNKMVDKDRQTELKQLLRYIDQQERNGNSSLSKILSGDFTKIPQGTYKPTEYPLRRELQSQLSKALQELPKEFRPRLHKLPYDNNTIRVNASAVKIMQQQLRSFDLLFKKYSDLNYSTFVKTLRSSEDPAVQLALSIVNADQIDVSMRRPESGRFWIPRTGFQNQYVTGSSKGFNGEVRKNAESIFTNKSVEDYWALDNEVLPKYGTLRAANETGLNNDLQASKQYGSDIYVFKKTEIEDRLSFFPGDSLNHLRSNTWFTGGKSQEKKLTSDSWDQLFIPWKRRLLMVPFMVKDIRTSNSFRAPLPSELTPEGFKESQHYYWESQIFGKLTLDMVETFEFQGTPPTGEFLAQLKKHKIKIIDGRQQPAVEWTEPKK